MIRLPLRLLAACLAVPLFAAPLPARAQAATDSEDVPSSELIRRAETPFMRYRGAVELRDNDLLTVRLRRGGTLTVRLQPKTRVYAAVRSVVRDIKPESYVGIVSEPGAEPFVTRMVTIFSPSERGFEAGSKPWDTAPGATFTAGWIDALSGRDNRRIHLRYPDGDRSFTVPAGTPTTQMGPGERGLLVPGADVTVFVHTDAAGSRNADFVVVGRQGATPTL